MPYKKLIISVQYKGGRNTLEPPVINNTDTAATVARTITDRKTLLWREEAFILCLNHKNTLIGWNKIGIGGQDTVVIDSRIIATIALSCAASGVILVHNHPGGDPLPSKNDLITTEKVRAVLNVIDISLIDHIIITEKSYFSMKEQGLF